MTRIEVSAAGAAGSAGASGATGPSGATGAAGATGASSSALGATVTENFQRANENPVGAGSVGPGPDIITGTWQITSNQLVVSNTAEALIGWYTNTLNYTLTTVVDAPSGDGGVMWHLTASAGAIEYYLLEVNAGVHGGNYTVFYRVGGTFIEYPGTGDTGVAPAANDTILLTVRGPKTIISINSVAVFTAYTHGVAMSPFAGFRSNSDTALKVRNLAIVGTV